jgi:hypothetical protein
MSFVGGSFTHDIFISYSHGRDLPTAYIDPRRNPLYQWSCILVDNLQSQIELLLSDSDQNPDVWMDPRLNTTGSLEGNLEKEIQSSALFLTLMSTYYLRSPWCADEARLFAESAQSFPPISRQDRTFVLSVTPTDRSLWPPALRDDQQRAFQGMDFYRRIGSEDWTPLAFPEPKASPDREYGEYWAAI